MAAPWCDLADRQDGWALAELARQISSMPPVIVATASPEAGRPLVAGWIVAKPVDPSASHSLVHKEQQGRSMIGRIRRCRAEIRLA